LHISRIYKQFAHFGIGIAFRDIFAKVFNFATFSCQKNLCKNKRLK
jgi:hypothetical protein